MQSRTLAQHLFEIGRSTVLLQQAAKSLVGQYDALSDLARGCASD
jgi:hypothetical protein